MQSVKQNYFEQLGKLTKRHLLVFFNNRMRVFFTLMVPFIVFVIYIFFLRNLELLTVKDVFSDSTIDELKNFDPSGNTQVNKYVGAILDSWMLSGIMAFSTLTVSLQTNNIIVADKENGINRDFASSPVSNTVLIISYFVYSFVVTLIVSFIFLIVCFIYLDGKFRALHGIYLFVRIQGHDHGQHSHGILLGDRLSDRRIHALLHDACRRAERMLFHSGHVLLFAVQICLPRDPHIRGERIYRRARPPERSGDYRGADGQLRV